MDRVLSGEDGMVGWALGMTGFLELLNSSAEFNPFMI